MTHDTTPRDIRPADLPRTVLTFLAAHAARETDAAALTFTQDAVVVDQAEAFHGIEQVRRFLQDSGSEFTYTTELIGARHRGDARWEVVNRIAGDFPGNVAELSYRFTLDDELISELTIG